MGESTLAGLGRRELVSAHPPPAAPQGVTASHAVSAAPPAGTAPEGQYSSNQRTSGKTYAATCLCR